MSDLTFSVRGQSNSATKFTAKARQFVKPNPFKIKIGTADL